MSCPASHSDTRKGGFLLAPKAGFSIVEFSVMSVLMGMMMVGTVSWMTSMQRSSNKVQAEASELNFQTFLSETINPAVCSDTFAGKKIGESIAQIKASSKYCYSESGIPDPNTHGCTASFDRDVPGCDPLQDPLKACSSDTDCGAGNHCESRSSVFWDINSGGGVYGRNFKVMKVRTSAASSSGSAFALGRANLEVFFSRPGTGFEKREEGRPCSWDASAGTANQAGCYKLTCPMQLTGSPARGREGSDEVGSCRMLKCGGGTLKITAVAPPIAVLCGGAGTAGSFHSNGGGFVQSTAAVADTAHVGKMAVVCGRAKVEGYAKIMGNAQVLDQATVKDNALVYDSAKVSGSATVQDSAKVYGMAWISGSAVIQDNAEIYGNAQISGPSAKVRDSAQVYDMAKVRDSAQVYDKAKVWGIAQISDQARVYGNGRGEQGAQVFGAAHIYQKARIYNHARVQGGAKVRGEARVYGHAGMTDTSSAYEKARIYGYAGIRGEGYVRQHGQVRGGAVVARNWVAGHAIAEGQASIWGSLSGYAHVKGKISIMHTIHGRCKCFGGASFPAGFNRDRTTANCNHGNCSKTPYFAQ